MICLHDCGQICITLMVDLWLWDDELAVMSRYLWMHVVLLPICICDRIALYLVEGDAGWSDWQKPCSNSLDACYRGNKGTSELYAVVGLCVLMLPWLLMNMALGTITRGVFTRVCVCTYLWLLPMKWMLLCNSYMLNPCNRQYKSMMCVRCSGTGVLLAKWE